MFLPIFSDASFPGLTLFSEDTTLRWSFLQPRVAPDVCPSVHTGIFSVLCRSAHFSLGEAVSHVLSWEPSLPGSRGLGNCLGPAWLLCPRRPWLENTSTAISWNNRPSQLVCFASVSEITHLYFLIPTFLKAVFSSIFSIFACVVKENKPLSPFWPATDASSLFLILIFNVKCGCFSVVVAFFYLYFLQRI